MRSSRFAILILAGLALAAVVTSAQAQRKCKEGTVATATGTVGKIISTGGVEEIFTREKQPKSQCRVSSIVFLDVRCPANYVVGKKFTASGEVELDLSATNDVLYVTSIRCE